MNAILKRLLVIVVATVLLAAYYTNASGEVCITVQDEDVCVADMTPGQMLCEGQMARDMRASFCVQREQIAVEYTTEKHVPIINYWFLCAGDTKPIQQPSRGLQPAGWIASTYPHQGRKLVHNGNVRAEQGTGVLYDRGTHVCTDAYTEVGGYCVHTEIHRSAKASCKSRRYVSSPGIRYRR